jgi:hypothetical protein
MRSILNATLVLLLATVCAANAQDRVVINQ